VRTATRPTGESINEDKIVPGGEKSAGMSFKGHDAKKNGIFACLLATEAVAASEASLSEPFGGAPAVVLKQVRSACVL
jgi:phosphomannomutase